MIFYVHVFCSSSSSVIVKLKINFISFLQQILVILMILKVIYAPQEAFQLTSNSRFVNFPVITNMTNMYIEPVIKAL